MEKEKGGECKCLYPFHISCTKLYVKYGEGMLGYCPIPLYPNSIYMIVLNVLHTPRRKLSMNLQPHFPVPCFFTPQFPPPPPPPHLPSTPPPPPPSPSPLAPPFLLT